MEQENYQYKSNSNEATLEMKVSDFMRDAMMKELGFEVEMLQGEYRPLAGGMHYYKIVVPPHKQEIIKMFFQYLLQNPTNDSSVKVMNYPVNNN